MVRLEDPHVRARDGLAGADHESCATLSLIPPRKRGSRASDGSRAPGPPLSRGNHKKGTRRWLRLGELRLEVGDGAVEALVELDGRAPTERLLGQADVGAPLLRIVL